MNLIYGEILQGTVDGINKTYTTQNTVDTVVELRIGGVPYVDFTISGRIITLDDAIPVDEDLPELDYYFLDNLTDTTTPDITVQNILDDVLVHIGINAYNTAYKQATALKYINEVYFGELNRNKNNKVIGNYGFTKGSTYKYGTFYRGDIIPVQGLIDNYTPRVGKFMLNGLIVDFTTRTDSAYTLPDGLVVTAESGDLITPGYKLPNVVRDVNTVTVGGIPFKRVTKDQFRTKAIYGEYCVFEGYLYISSSGVEQVVINYTKKNDIFSTVDDIVDIPFEYRDILSLYPAYKMTRFREDSRSVDIENEYTKLKRKYVAYINRHSKTNFEIDNFNGPLNGL